MALRCCLSSCSAVGSSTGRRSRTGRIRRDTSNLGRSWSMSSQGPKSRGKRSSGSGKERSPRSASTANSSRWLMTGLSIWHCAIVARSLGVISFLGVCKSHTTAQETSCWCGNCTFCQTARRAWHGRASPRAPYFVSGRGNRGPVYRTPDGGGA